MTFELSLLLNLAIQNVNITVKQMYTMDKYQDFSVNACTNYYERSCARWTHQHNNSNYKEITGLIDHEINTEMLDLIRNNENSTNIIMGKMQTFLNACGSQKSRPPSSYLKIVKPAEGLEWPLLDKNVTWPNDKFHWLLTLANLRRFGLNKVLIKESVSHDLNDSKTFLINIDIPDSEMKPILPAQQKIIALLNNALHFPISKTFALNNKLRDLEIELFHLQKKYISFEVNILTLAELSEKVPQLPWKEYLQMLTNQNIDEHFILQISNLEYFRRLGDLLEKTEKNEPTLVCNYLMILFMYNAHSHGSKSAKELDCLADMRNKMELAFNYFYYENFFREKAQIYKKDVSSILESIRTEFHKKLNANKLKLNNEELQYFRKKLNAMKLKIGNIPENFNEQFVEEYYASIELDAENYVQNQLDLQELNFWKENERLLQPLKNIDDFFVIGDELIARSSSPYFSLQLNWITIPFGFLRFPIYHPELHDVLKYGLLGFNIAHEMGHGFDLDGIFYGEHGHLSYEIAEGIQTNKIYAELIECLELSGSTAIKERFADFIGLQLALDAFQKRESSKEKLIFGNPMMRAFFFSFAQFFCGNLEANFIDHDPDNVRLEWTISQNDAFKEAFNCKKSRRNDDENVKCQLW